MLFDTFFDAFPGTCLKDSAPRPKVLKRHGNGAPQVPKWRAGVPNWSPEVPRSTKKTPTCTPNSPKVSATATLELQGHSQCPKNTTRPPMVLMHWVRAQGARKTRTNRPRPGARRRRRRSGRGLEGRAHQAARRSPMQGYEVQVHKSVVLVIN